MSTIRWYRASPGAGVFPAQHAFGSLVWEGDYLQAYEGPGEFTRARQWVPCTNPGCKGRHEPLDLTRFLQGLSAADRVAPAPVPCCEYPPLWFPMNARIGARGSYVLTLMGSYGSALGLTASFEIYDVTTSVFDAIFGLAAFSGCILPGSPIEQGMDAWIPAVPVQEVMVRELAAMGAFTFHLYDNALAIGGTTVLTDFSEMSYPGYSAVLAAYSGPAFEFDTRWTISFDPVQFTGPTSGAPVAPLGFYVTYTILGVEHLLFCAEFPSAVTLELPDQIVQIDAQLQFSDCTHP